MVDLFDWHLRVSETDPNFAGNAQWAFKDFGTPIRPENPLPFVNMKGLVQRDGVKKDVYHVFASYWKKDPVCWIESPRWNYRTGSVGEEKTISVFCNTDSAELSLNGKPLGAKTRDITQYPASGLTWDVAFKEGENILSVNGFNSDGNVVAEHEYDLKYVTQKHGKMVDIILTASDNPDGSVTVFAEAQDKDGLRVVDMNNRAYFTIDGGGKFLKHQGTPMGSQVRELGGYYIKIPAKK